MSFALDNDEELIESIIDPLKSMSLAWEMVKSAREEILILFSSANAFARQEHEGAVELLKE